MTLAVRTTAMVLAAAIALACGRTGSTPSMPSQEWTRFVAEFENAYFRADPPFAVYQGRHEFDGQLPDWSRTGIERWSASLSAMRDKAAAFDATVLTDGQRFERDYLVAVADGQLFWLTEARLPFKNPYYYSGPLDPNVYVAREYAPLAERLKAYTKYARAVPAAADEIRANLETPLPRTYVDIGKLTFGGLADYYEKDVPLVFQAITDPDLLSEFREANAGAIRAMRSLDAWLDGERKRATGSFALGPALFARMLSQTERIDVPLDELERIGRADLDRNLAALRQACATYAPGKTIAACIADVEAIKPPGGPIATARRQLDELKRFVLDKALVTIPGQEQARVEEAPPYQRYNSAYIDIPGPYDKGVPSIYYVAPADPSWSKAEQDAYIPGRANLLFVSVHEVWPGHFLQFLHSNRAASIFGQVFVGYAFAEGWAHYTEELMWDVGLGGGSPEMHIGQLTNALLRNVRYLSTIGLHTKGMTVEESEALFRDSGYQDPATARQQAARGTFDPGYLNYTLGKLMIRQLRDDWSASRGGQSAWREFHDTFLGYGGPPIPLVRKSMLGASAGPALR